MGRKKKLKRPPLEEDTSDLPCDIIQNILCRVPVKSLLRFKSVSKPWYSIISDAQFAKAHLNQAKTYLATSRTRVFHRQYDSGVREFPEKKYEEAMVLCSYDGLVLLTNERGDYMYVIWNPSTRAYTKFKCPYRMFAQFVTAAICYDQCNDNYKVLVMDEYNYATFSFKKNSWTEKGTITPYRNVEKGNDLVVAQGVAHYFVFTGCKELSNTGKEKCLELLSKECKKHSCYGYSPHYDNHPAYRCNYGATREIFYFDHRDDKPKKLPKPPCLDDTCVVHLVSLRDQLCLYRNTYDFTMIEIWMMKEYGNPNSWMRLFTIENMPAPHRCQSAKPFCFTDEGDLVIHFSYGKDFIYSPTTKEFREGQRGRADSLCFDSLVLPKRTRKYKRRETEK